MNHIVKYKILLWLMPVLLLLGAVISPPREAAALTLCTTSDPGHFDPSAMVAHPADKSWSLLIYERLVQLDPSGETVSPALATSWEISDDGKTYRFQLRQNVAFHSNIFFKPTRFLNADDVVYSFKRLQDQDHSLYAWNGLNRSEFDQSTLGIYLTDVRKISDFEVEFEFSQAHSELLVNFSHDFSSIISAEYGAILTQNQSIEDYFRYPVGTGPYRLVSYHKDVLVNLRPFSVTWQQTTLDPNILIVPYEDEQMRIEKLLQNECDIIPNISPKNIELMRDQLQIELIKLASTKTIYLAYNTKAAPMNAPLVRQGLERSINKFVIQDAIYNNYADILYSPIPSGNWSYNDRLEGMYGYSITDSRELFNQASSLNFDLTLWLPEQATVDMPDPELFVEILAADWALAGVQLSAEFVSNDELLRLAADPNRLGAVLLFNQTSQGAPESYLDQFRCNSQQNYAHWCNEIFERLMQAADFETDLDIRYEYYLRAQEVIMEETPISPLFSHFLYIPINKQVKGFYLTQQGLYNLIGVTKTRNAQF
ncbi:MAG: ABC transporter substrate-binding protein [Alphaproteobacteria bacterium]